MGWKGCLNWRVTTPGRCVGTLGQCAVTLSYHSGTPRMSCMCASTLSWRTNSLYGLRRRGGMAKLSKEASWHAEEARRYAERARWCAEWERWYIMQARMQARKYVEFTRQYARWAKAGGWDGNF